MSFSLLGANAVPVHVEVEVSPGFPAYEVVGLAAPSVKESGVRVRAALEAAGRVMPRAKVTVNLAPADLRKRGGAFDLPIAVAVLAADHKVCLDPLQGLILLGELGLDGSVRAVPGAHAAAMLARARGWRGVLVPRENVQEAATVDGLEVFGVGHLAALLAALSGTPLPPPPRPASAAPPLPRLVTEARGPRLAGRAGARLQRLRVGKVWTTNEAPRRAA